ncbi:cytochrome c biogenesis protein ResB [Vitreoscilla massiliensis]|uniref:Cytochrome c biogenesis protein ResB n=1 Tax=Vitreoscilla massiliensis TaxID=1689272 RepID=A0ABY4DWM9_9NEIS|nr:cytochrome c biogenesis protein ResB [Vitreoscilla massiliensis]UOO87922.1 cytochrome c biogenesis protein ResB [Vitreoscilla massiliensis]
MKKAVPLIRRPWFAFLSSMRFAVALLSLLAIASVVGTVLQQNQPIADYVIKFGPFWFEIFKFLGLFDVYASGWFVVIMLFLVISTSLCLWRNVPPFWREMRSYRLKATAQSLGAMKHSSLLTGRLSPEILTRYLNVQGFQVKQQVRDDGSVILAAKKGSASKLGYIFAHVAIIVICIGGLVDSNMGLNLGVLTGRIVPDKDTMMAKDFAPNARLDAGSLSYRGNVTIAEGKGADVVFLNAGDGLVVQELPFSVELNKFHVEYYDTGMPKNFASDITVIDHKTGKKQDATIKVNHPLIVDGVAIYQASFGDGGSELSFNAWDMRKAMLSSAPMQATSMNTYPLNMNGQEYKLEFGEFRMLNVEDQSLPQAEKTGLAQKMHDVRDVNKANELKNVGPTITYKVRDKAGQAVEYLAYMLPLTRDGQQFFAVGERVSPADPYKWVMMPVDRNGELKTFMLLRQGFADPALRSRAVGLAVNKVNEAIRPQFSLAVDNVLRLFSEGGYVALDEFIAQNVPAAEQERMRQFFLEVLQASSGYVLDEVLKQANEPEWADTPERSQFIANASIGMTGLAQVKAPLYLQLTEFKQVQASGLQMAKSPGRYLVYLGSLLLILGTLCMFYVREKRLWVLLGPENMRVAMSATRHARDLDTEFPQHVARISQLLKDIPQ